MLTMQQQEDKITYMKPILNDNKTVLLTAKLRDIVYEGITAYIEKNPGVQIHLPSSAAQQDLANFIACYLSPSVEEYEDEISSLWFMLDELKASDRALHTGAMKDEVAKMVDSQLALLKFMSMNKGDA
jgi:hypothetical protein